MPGSFTDYLEDKVLRHVLTNTAYTSPTTIYVGLFTVAPTDTGGGTEVSTTSTGYARQTGTFSVSGTGTTASNSVAIEYPTATASWGTIVAVALFDAASGGNMLMYSTLNTNRTINSGDIFRIPAGSLTVTLD